MIWTNRSFKISDDNDSIEFNIVVNLLNSSHWASNRSKEAIKLSIENSLCFGLFTEGSQIGFARIITDYATYAVILDMIIAEQYRGQGLGKWLMEVITNHHKIQSLRQILWTSTAENLYKKFEFSEISEKPKVLVKPLF